MKKLLDFLYPTRCLLCGNTSDNRLAGQLCDPCATDIPLNPGACKHCAIPLIATDSHSPQPPVHCAQCIKTPPVYESCWSPFIYAQPLEWMIQQLKFNAKLDLAPLLSRLVLENLPAHLYTSDRPDVIIPMPLHSRRLQQRGFNQSHLLIKPIAQALNLPLDLNSSKRIRDTEHQTGKNAHQRRQNIKNAFSYNHKYNHQHVVIFDDVVTTGSSVSELTKTLKRGGVKRVDIWCLARAENKR